MSLLQKKIIVPVISSQPGNCAGSDHCTAVKVFLRCTNSLQDRVPEEHIGYEVGDLRTADSRDTLCRNKSSNKEQKVDERFSVCQNGREPGRVRL